MKNKLKLKRVFIIAVIVILIYVIYVAISICKFSKVDQVTKADAALVLGAGVWGDKPSPVFEERINHAIWLYQNGYVKKIIFTGGKGEDGDYSDSSIAKRYAMEYFIPGEDILIEEESRITQENIANSIKITDENNISTVIIVSDPLHMKRAMLMAEDYGLTAFSSPTPTTRYKTLKTKIPFLAREVFFYIGYKIYRIFC